ncbi:hypothetical protein [Bradyrhizobium sp. BR 1432]|uniref:hypothetical protein n=1 Tax=Bradyrhizobium sp. BR 1432 TaxID=3447966 RepID=UPI003EE6127A
MIVFLGMMMAKDLIQVSARSREVSRQEEAIATPPKKAMPVTPAINPASTVNRLPSGIPIV